MACKRVTGIDTGTVSGTDTGTGQWHQMTEIDTGY